MGLGSGTGEGGGEGKGKRRGGRSRKRPVGLGRRKIGGFSRRRRWGRRRKRIVGGTGGGSLLCCCSQPQAEVVPVQMNEAQAPQYNSYVSGMTPQQRAAYDWQLAGYYHMVPQEGTAQQAQPSAATDTNFSSQDGPPAAYYDYDPFYFAPTITENPQMPGFLPTPVAYQTTTDQNNNFQSNVFPSNEFQSNAYQSSQAQNNTFPSNQFQGTGNTFQY